MPTPVQAALQAFLQGSGDIGGLLEIASQARAEVEATRTQLGQSLQNEHEKVRAAVAAESNLVEECFQDYFRMLAACDRNPDSLLVDNLGLVQNRLNLALQRLRSVVLAERGPFTHPALNHALQASTHLAEFQAAVDEHLEVIEALLGDAKVRLLEEEREALQALLQLLRSAPLDALPDAAWTRSAQELGPQLARVDRDFFQRHYQGGPTPFPTLNLVIHGSHMVDTGRLSEETWEYFVAQARATLQEKGPIVALLDAPDLADQIPRLVELADRMARDAIAADF